MNKHLILANQANSITEDDSSDDFQVFLPSEYVQKSQHLTVEALAGLLQGSASQRALKLFLLETIAAKTHTLDHDGQAEWPSIADLERLFWPHQIEALPKFVEKMHKVGLLQVYGKPYRYGLTATASTILAFLRLIFDFEEEEGLTSAIVTNINLIQLRKTAHAPLEKQLQTFKDILSGLIALNRKLEDALRDHIRAELDQASADLELIHAYVEPLRDYSDEFALLVQEEGVNPGKIVYWLNHGRIILNTFENLAYRITNYYLDRSKQDAQGVIPLDNIEKMLTEYAQTENGWQKIVEWGNNLDCFVALGSLPLHSILEAYQEVATFEVKALLNSGPTTTISVQQEKVYQWNEDEGGEVELLMNFLQQNIVTHIIDIVTEDDWSMTAGRICALDDVLEWLKDRTGEEWGLTLKPGATTFPSEAQVKQLTNAEIGLWMSLNEI